MASKGNPTRRKEDVIVKELEGELLIYDLRIDKAYCLNETSAFVWQACDGNKSVSEIRQQLSKVLNRPVTEDLVVLALDQLDKENLLSTDQGTERKFFGLSRREAIRKVGVGSMVALPLISSLVVPSAKAAASRCGQPCNINTPCPGCVCDTTIGFCV
jgi:hypothetical protein